MRAHRRRAQRRAEHFNAVGKELQAARAQASRQAHNLVVVKLTIFVGLSAWFYLPPEHREWAAYAANVLWLWKT